jgi:hypothetical protein
MKYGRDKFYQWDLNQYLVVDDKEIKQLHFTNAVITEALITEVIDGVAAVPNILLQTDWDISVYGTCGECVRDMARFKVEARAKPADYVYTETEVMTWERLENDINAAINALNEAEADRVAAELERRDNEALRQDTEAIRIQAEERRELAEDIRQEDTENAIRRLDGGVETAMYAAEQANLATAALYGASGIYGNAVKGKEVGTGAVVIKDTSPLEHNINVNLKKKNIVDIKNPSYTLNAVYEVDSEGVATLTRGNLATGAAQTYASRAYWEFGNYDDFVGKTFTLSMNVVEKSTASADIVYILGDFNTKAEKIIKTANVTTTGKKAISFTIPKNTDGLKTLGFRFYCQSLGLDDSVGEYTKFKELQVEEGSVATDYSPYVEKDIEDITITKYGKNFVDYSKAKSTSSATLYPNGNELTLVRDKEGNPPSIIINLGKYKKFIGKPVTVSFTLTDLVIEGESSKTSLAVHIGDTTKENVKSVTAIGFTSSDIGKRLSAKVNKMPYYEDSLEKDLTLRFYLQNGKTIGDTLSVKDIQVEVGTTATEYEEYKEPITYETTENITSYYPTTTLLVEDGIIIEAEYNKDINKVIESLTQAIISMGGNV